MPCGKRIDFSEATGELASLGLALRPAPRPVMLRDGPRRWSDHQRDRRHAKERAHRVSRTPIEMTRVRITETERRALGKPC